MRNKIIVSKILRVLVPAKFFLGAFAFAILILGSCKKDSNLGLNVQPGADLLGVNVSDTTAIVTWTKKVDSLRTSGILSQYVLGTYWDPIFGKASASIYTQFVLPGANVNIDFDPVNVLKNLTCDSIVMTLSYGKIFYGDTTASQTIKVYQMTGAIATNTFYKSDTAISVYPVPIGVKTFYPTPRSKTILRNRPVGTHIRVTIDKSFGQMILDQSGQQALSSNANFTSFIKGFYISAENSSLTSGRGAMLYLPMTDTLTKLTLYYRNRNLTPPADSTLNFSFEVNVNAARFARFDHDFSVSDPLVQSQINAITHPCQPIVFVSALAGVKTKVEFPNIMNWVKGGPVSVNKAQVVIKVAPGTMTPPPFGSPVYDPIAKLALVNIDSLGHELIMVDNLEGVDYFGGIYDAVNNQYTFNIARYVQQVLSGKQRNNGLYLLATSSAVTANRVILGGGNNNSGYKAYMRLAYTRVH